MRPGASPWQTRFAFAVLALLGKDFAFPTPIQLRRNRP